MTAAAEAQAKAALAEEEKRAKEKEEARLKEPAKAKLVRLLAALRAAAGGSAKKEILDDIEATVAGLKTEEKVGDSDVEKAKAKEAAEREKAEKEAHRHA